MSQLLQMMTLSVFIYECVQITSIKDDKPHVCRSENLTDEINAKNFHIKIQVFIVEIPINIEMKFYIGSNF